jgi:hypothetical protein
MRSDMIMDCLSAGFRIAKNDEFIFGFWPIAPAQHNAENLSEANSANFAANSFPGLESISAAGQLLPPGAATDWSSVRLLYAVTCRTPYACNSALAGGTSIRQRLQLLSAVILKLPGQKSGFLFRMSASQNDDWRLATRC